MLAEDTPPALPPTPTRIRLVKDISDEKVLDYVSEPIWTYSTTEDREVTKRVDELERCGIATRDTEVHTYYRYVALTPAGEEWLAKYGSNE